MLSLLIVSLAVQAPEWSLLAFPRSTRDFVAPPSESVLADAAHLDIYGSFRAPDAEPSEPAVSGALFQQMLEETLRQRGAKLELRPQAGLLLARGDAAALEVARALTADLDRQMAAFEIDLEITLRTSAGETKWLRRVPAGTDVYFGSRATRPFIAGFEVQVAQDAGQAEPRLGSALFGTGLHLRASRIAGGTRVFVDGVFDSASIAAVEAFDPMTPDMGVFEQPRIDSVQIAFAGAMASGGALEVRLADAGPLRGESVLSVRATARPDAAPTQDGWALIDLSFTSFAPRALESVDAGLGLASTALDLEQQGALLTPPTLASILESDRSAGDGRTGRALLYWSRSMLALPRSDAARIEAARALARVAEDAGTATRIVTLASGSLRASFPIAADRTARFVAGTETVYLTDYGLEVAPQIWMPSPHVDRAFDGVAARMVLQGGGIALDAWRSSTPEVVIASHEAAQMGRLQLPVRARVAGSARTTEGETSAVVFDEGAPLTLSANGP